MKNKDKIGGEGAAAALCARDKRFTVPSVDNENYNAQWKIKQQLTSLALWHLARKVRVCSVPNVYSAIFTAGANNVAAFRAEERTPWLCPNRKINRQKKLMKKKKKKKKVGQAPGSTCHTFAQACTASHKHKRTNKHTTHSPTHPLTHSHSPVLEQQARVCR